MSKPGKKNIVIAVLSIVIAVGLGFFGGYEYRGYEISNAITNAFSGTSDNKTNSSDSTNNSTDGKQGLKSNYHQQSDTIKFSTQTLKVNSAKSETTITSQYGNPWVAKQGTKFVVVDHTVTNTTSSPITYVPFELFTSDGTRYDASSEVFASVDNYMNGRQLAPNVPEQGVAVYIVPTSVKNVEFGGRNSSTDILELFKLSVD